MKKFQLQFIDKNKSGSYKYFETDKDDYKEKAIEVANEFHNNNGGQRLFAGFNPYKPLKTIQVVEYDKVTHKSVRGGIKFKLKFSRVYTNLSAFDFKELYTVKE